jgi:LysM repeat protein
MKKFVLRLTGALMIVVMMVLTMGSMSDVKAAEEKLDIATRVFKSGEEPADNADGSITFSDQKSMKASFALPKVLNAGESITVNVKLQFDSADDAGVRFYLINGGVDSNTATEIQAIANEATGTVIEKTFTLTAANTSSELLFASSGYGININNVTIHEITLGEKAAESADGLVSINLAERIFKSGEEPADNADGSITFSDQKSMKAAFALPEKLMAGESITVNVRLKFDSADDAGVRFYLIYGGVDSNTAKEIQAIASEKVGKEIEKTFTLTASSDSTEILFASSGYGININNVTIYEITLGDKPVSDVPSGELVDGKYEVQAGDTLWEISKMFDVKVEDIMKANNIENPRLIFKGAKLTIPTLDPNTQYKVVKGDTLYKIAKQHGCDLAELAAVNGITNVRFIMAGQILILP